MFHCLYPSTWKNADSTWDQKKARRHCFLRAAHPSKRADSQSMPVATIQIAGHHCLFPNPGAVKVHRFDPRISSVGKKCSQNNEQRWSATLHPDDQSYCHVYMFICMSDSLAGKQELQFAWSYQHFNYCPVLKLAELLDNFQPCS